jgi:hypothetical protein
VPFFRGHFPNFAVRRTWGLDGTPVWELRFTSRVEPEPEPAPEPTRTVLLPPHRHEPVRFVSSRGVEIGADTLRIDQFHHRIRKPALGFTEPPEASDIATDLVQLAANPDHEPLQQRVVARLALVHSWFRNATLLDISAARITGSGLGQLLDGVFVWRAEGGTNITYLVAPDAGTKDLLKADSDLIRALIRAACPHPEDALSELEDSLREALTRLGLVAQAQPIRETGVSPSAGVVLEVTDPSLPEPPVDGADLEKSPSERALSEELAELARKVGTASVRTTGAAREVG